MMISIHNNRGFSLIEVLAATVILMILVMAMSMIFHQASNSWSAGLRKTEGNMNGRSLLGFISRDLQAAVADPDMSTGLQGLIQCTTNIFPTIMFVTLNGNVSTNYRAATRVSYNFSGGKVTRVEDKMRIGGGGYGTWESGAAVVLAENLTEFGFATPLRDADDPYTGPYIKDLPKWVRVKAVFSWAADVSGIRALSDGPDKIAGTADDISSN